MKFYPGDWFGDNITLTHEEFGVYTRMMCRYWMRDGIPWSLDAIAEEIGDRGTEHIETIQKVLDKKFTKSRGKKWVHKDLESARTEVRTYLLKKSGEGHAGNDARKVKREAKDASDDDPSGGEVPDNPSELADSEDELPIKPKSAEDKDTCDPPSTSLATSLAAPLSPAPASSSAASLASASATSSATPAMDAVPTLPKKLPITSIKIPEGISPEQLQANKDRLHAIQKRDQTA